MEYRDGILELFGCFLELRIAERESGESKIASVDMCDTMVNAGVMM